MQYGALLVVDPEEEVYAEEVSALHAHVGTHGLGLLVFAEWYNVDTMVKMRFFDDNTRSWWTPATGEAPSHHSHVLHMHFRYVCSICVCVCSLTCLTGCRNACFAREMPIHRSLAHQLLLQPSVQMQCCQDVFSIQQHGCRSHVWCHRSNPLLPC